MTFGLLPPSSNVTRFNVSAAAFWMILAVSTWPVKAILSTSGCAHQGRAGGLAQAVDDVDHPGREARLAGELGDAQGRQRRLLGRLHHDRVAARQRRAPLPGQHQEREVPGDDLADHADRLAQRVREEAAADRDRPALDLVGPARVVAQRVADALHVALRVGDRLAAVERLERGQLGGVLLDQVGQLEQQPAAIGGVHRAPGARFEGPPRRLDRLVDVGRAGRRDLGDHLARRRVVRLELAAIDRVDPLIVDEQLGQIRPWDGTPFWLRLPSSSPCSSLPDAGVRLTWALGISKSSSERGGLSTPSPAGRPLRGRRCITWGQRRGMGPD